MEAKDCNDRKACTIHLCARKLAAKGLGDHNSQRALQHLIPTYVVQSIIIIFVC